MSAKKLNEPLDPLTRLIMVAESLEHDPCGECGASTDDAHILREVHADLKARIEVLTAALTEIADDPEHGPHAKYHEYSCRTCRARAALAAGETESEAHSKS